MLQQMELPPCLQEPAVVVRRSLALQVLVEIAFKTQQGAQVVGGSTEQEPHRLVVTAADHS